MKKLGMYFRRFKGVVLIPGRKSKLRKPTTVSLGPAYRGSKISRDALEGSDEDDHDPFAEDYDESEEDELMDDGLDAGEESDSGDDDMDEDDDEESEDDMNHKPLIRAQHDDDTAEVKKMLAQSQKAVTSTLSQGAKEEVEKGNAIKEQRALFDKLLGVRIKLQKALISVNTLPTVEATPEDGPEAIEAAQAAAFRLLHSIDSLRKSFTKAHSTSKRKYDALKPFDSLPEIHSKLEDYEHQSKKQRNSTLDLWATKTRHQNTIVPQRRLTTTAQPESTLSQVLAEQLGGISRLVSKTETPRSCAPIQAKMAQLKSQPSTPGITDLPLYDDAPFYTTLLQQLISQRSITDSSLTSLSASFPVHPWQAAREAKTRKNVDTKASKGRRLKYTVHEKLQDSMGREDRNGWSDRQCDELFAGILGRRVELGDEEVEEEDGGDVERGVESLRLFAGA